MTDILTPQFLLTALVICLTPGMGVLYTLSVTLGGGLRAGLWAIIGCTIATVLHMGVAMAGLAAVLHTSAILFQTIKFAGVLYLLWMAWAVLQDRGSMAITPERGGARLGLLRRGILLNILNPKLPLFFVAFLPQFLPPDAGTSALVTLGLAFAALTFLTFLFYAVVAASGRRAILSSPAVLTWMRRAFAACFAALGLKLAFERAA